MSTHADRTTRDRDAGERPERAMFACGIDLGDLVLRQAGVADLEALASLHGDAARDPLERDGETHALMSGGLLVAEEDGRVVAGVAVRVAGVPGSTRGADALMYWTVAPHRRREGIGRRVAMAVATRVVEAGCDAVTVIAAADDPGAIGHLDALGFDVGDAYPGKRVVASIDADAVLGPALSPGPR